MFGPLVTAVRTLTIIPIPGKDAADFSRSLPWFPVVGLLIGFLYWAIAQGGMYLWSDHHLITGCFVALAGVVVTGALHLDGLADCADGFGGGKTRERILEIFKDSRHGTFGVSVITGDLLLRTVLGAWCVAEAHTELLIVAAFFSRSAAAWMCTLVPYARSTGGTAEPFVVNKPSPLLFIVTAGLIAALLLKTGMVHSGGSMVFAGIPVIVFAAYCMKKIGGSTGDCLGAASEIGELSVLTAGSILFKFGV
jgi:adenosylcobinamide-GDP ribazoletransferase